MFYGMGNRCCCEYESNVVGFPHWSMAMATMNKRHGTNGLHVHVGLGD